MSVIIHGQKFDKRVDASSPVTIPVSRKDFQAKARNPAMCVVAKAVMRQKIIDGREAVSVWIGASIADIVYKDDPKTCVRYQLSKKTAALVHAFDEHPEAVSGLGGVVGNAVIVDLIVPSHSQRLGRKRKSGTNKRSGRKKPEAPLRHLYAQPA